MTSSNQPPLRVALLRTEPCGAADTLTVLAQELRAAGIDPVLLDPPSRSRKLTALLRRRGFVESVGSAPTSLALLVANRFDVVHAFTPVDAAVACAARRVRPHRVVFSCLEAPDRSCIAHRRLVLQALSRALEHSDTLLAPNELVAAAMRRWLGVEAAVVCHTATSLAQVYQSLEVAELP